MHIQQKNPSERLSYYAVFKVLQEMTFNAHLFDVHDDIYYHADKFWWYSKQILIEVKNLKSKGRYMYNRMKFPNDQTWAAGIKKPFNMISSFRMLKSWEKKVYKIICK